MDGLPAKRNPANRRRLHLPTPLLPTKSSIHTDEHCPESLIQPEAIPSVAVPTVSASAERWMTELHALLRELEAVTAASHTLPPVFSEAVDDQLVQVRLGVAASLFAALQCKNAAVGRTRAAGGAELLGLGDEAGAAAGRARRHRSRRAVARRRRDRRAGPHPAEARRRSTTTKRR